MSIKFGGDKRDRTADLRSASASLSQTELYPHYLSGAGNEVRTRDIQLGRLTLYQLSYSRRQDLYYHIFFILSIVFL